MAARMEGVSAVIIDREWQWVDVSRKRIAQAAIDIGEATLKEAEEVGGTVQLGLFPSGDADVEDERSGVDTLFSAGFYEYLEQAKRAKS